MGTDDSEEKSVTLTLREWRFVAASLVAVETFEGPNSPGTGWTIKDDIENQLGLKLSKQS